MNQKIGYSKMCYQQAKYIERVAEDEVFLGNFIRRIHVFMIDNEN